MSTESTPDHDHEPGYGHGQEGGGDPEPPECPDCDPDLIDDLKCQAEGIAAQAAYNAETQPGLKQGRTDYDKARNDYRTARATATVEVQDLRHQVKQLVERIRCQITQQEVVDCLNSAFQHIRHRLEECGYGVGGCCSTSPCDVDKTCPDDYDELVRRIAEYEELQAREKACFDKLVGEPAKLTERVAAAKAEIDAINADLAGDAATVDLKRLYVASLVAQLHLRPGWIWIGFDDTRAYLDCLCRALTSWTKVTDAISALTGCKAVKDCQKTAHEAHCENLRTKTTEEVLLEYERLCGGEPCKDKDDGDDKDEGCDGGDKDDDGEGYGEGYGHGHGHGEDDDPPCGCDHGHDHRRSHHESGHRQQGAT